ncbi:MAG: CPBP family intramembrane glutamic endopeptidase, partial [Eubacteriales bacterium]
MAGTKSHGSIGVQITRGELIGGLIYLPFYLYLTPLFVQFLMETFGFAVTDASLNVWVFMVNFLAIAIIFRHFLIASISSIGGHFWDFLQSIVLGFSFYFALNWVLSLILVTTNLYTESANNEAVFTLAGDNYVMVVVCAVLLAPLVEEVIFRGMFFGLMHTKSRILAYVGSTLLFAALHVWQFVGAVGWG